MILMEDTKGALTVTVIPTPMKKNTLIASMVMSTLIKKNTLTVTVILTAMNKNTLIRMKHVRVSIWLFPTVVNRQVTLTLTLLLALIVSLSIVHSHMFMIMIMPIHKKVIRSAVLTKSVILGTS